MLGSVVVFKPSLMWIEFAKTNSIKRPRHWNKKVWYEGSDVAKAFVAIVC